MLVVAALTVASLLVGACRGESAPAPSPSATTGEVTATPPAAEAGVKPGPGVERSPKLLWRFRTGDEVWSSPAVVGGVVYIGSFDDYVYAISEG